MLTFRSPRTRRAAAAVLGTALAGLVAAGCGSPGSPSASSAAAVLGTAAGQASSGGAKGSGPVDVLYAGSLVAMMQDQIGPAFQGATGYSVTGFAAGSKDLATEIKGGVHQGDVFISASPAVNAALEGAQNGGWVSWYLTYATSGLVLGYNPDSRFAADLKSKPWYKAITEPGIRVGFTDPATDPKGQLTVAALDETAASRHLPALKAIAASPDNVFPEETLVGRLQSGQLDAGFFYNSEAVAAKIPTVPLTGVNLKASYTITVLNHAPHQAAAEAFVSYLLGPAGRAELKKDGFSLVSPATLSGTGLPAELRGLASQRPPAG